MINKSFEFKIGVIGLGYVGTPLACLFSKKYDTWGYDIKVEKVAKLAKSTMEDNRPVSKALEQGLKLTSNIDDLKKCNVYIIAVPTPVNKSNKPDISCVRNATAEVGKILKEGDIVVYESTVYPGLTEEVCAPLLASTSGLKLNQSFFVGFSPERINPGDTVHTIENIVKVTSGSTPEAAAIIDSLYASVLTHGTYRAKSIKIAEACKLMENCQRDIQIAFFNEMEKIFDKMNINIEDVTAAASTKWNFVPATPGLVGGHCIAVDPYYLINKAQEVDVVPSLLSTAREVNEQMAVWMAGKIKNASESRKFKAPETNVLILGFSFKPDSDDIRNTKVADLYINLVGAGYKTTLYDPLVDVKEVKEEYKQQEGDPQIKGRIRQRMREASQRRMMQNLPQADVVITNPTHYAVAIKYDPEVADAPIVIAKGEDYLAAKIKEIARDHQIEIVENKPLARMLYANVDVGQAVPPELYQAVAEVLAFVYHLQGKI